MPFSYCFFNNCEHVCVHSLSLHLYHLALPHQRRGARCVSHHSSQNVLTKFTNDFSATK